MDVCSSLSIDANI